MKRPLLPVALLYGGGILISCTIPLTPLLLLTGSLALALLALGWARLRPLLLALLLVMAGWTNHTLRTAVLSPHDLRRILGAEPGLVTVRGVIQETPTQRVHERNYEEIWRTMTRVNVSAIRTNRQAWQPAAGEVAVNTAGLLPAGYFVGQEVEITGVAGPPRKPAAQGLFDYRDYLCLKGIYYQVQASSEEDWKLVRSPSQAPLEDRFRDWGREALALGMPTEDEALRLEWALTLGWKTALTAPVEEPFIQAATYHIFAVDGLRMAIVFGILYYLLRACGISRPICGLIILPVIWFYTGLTGWPASAIRASVMLSVVILGWILKRPSDPMNSLFAAALIILAWEPRQLFQAGFQLSFFVVLALILIIPPIQKAARRATAPDPLLPESLRPRWRRWARGPVRFLEGMVVTSLAAWIGSIPLVAYYFNIVTPVSTPANVVAVPLCMLVLISNLSSLLLAAWFPAAAELFNQAGWFLMEAIRVSSQWFTHWPWAYFYVPAPSRFTIFIYYAVVLAGITGWLFQPRLRAAKIAMLAAVVALWGWQDWRDLQVTRLTVLAANGGLMIHYDAPGRQEDMLIDCGATNTVESLTTPFLRAHGVNRLPLLVLTHGDIKHVGGTPLLEQSFPVDRLCASPVRFRSPVYRRILQAYEHRPPQLCTVRRGDRLGIWAVLHPDAEDRFSQADDNSLVLCGVLGGQRVLLLSDLGRPGQARLLERNPDLRADIVVTGLPVQNEALGDPLLDALQPRLIIVADSEYPAQERAGSRLRERLAKRHIQVIYTRTAGAVTLRWRGREWIGKPSGESAPATASINSEGEAIVRAEQ